MYAIIEDSGTQIKVSEGDVIKVATRELSADTVSVTFDRILMVGGEGAELKVGQPVVDGAKVVADILAEDSEKYLITKFKRRKNYRRRKGHRQHFLRVKVTSIQA